MGASTTNIETRRKAVASTQGQVMKILEWSELGYCYFKYDIGLYYLDMLTYNDKEVAAALSRTRTFWNWWKNQWALRDEEYLAFINAHTPRRTEARRLYFYTHNPRLLIQEVTPSGVILSESYSSIVDSLNDEIKRPKSPD